MIVPTVGRVVWVKRAASEDISQPEAAIVIFVHDEHTINVEGWSANGHPFCIHKLHLVQDEVEVTEADCAMWMPYQKGQAAKTEALEKAANGAQPAAQPDYGKFEAAKEPSDPMPLASPDAT